MAATASAGSYEEDGEERGTREQAAPPPGSRRSAHVAGPWVTLERVRCLDHVPALPPVDLSISLTVVLSSR